MFISRIRAWVNICTESFRKISARGDAADVACRLRRDSKKERVGRPEDRVDAEMEDNKSVVLRGLSQLSR